MTAYSDIEEDIRHYTRRAERDGHVQRTAQAFVQLVLELRAEIHEEPGLLRLVLGEFLQADADGFKSLSELVESGVCRSTAHLLGFEPSHLGGLLVFEGQGGSPSSAGNGGATGRG